MLEHASPTTRLKQSTPTMSRSQTTDALVTLVRPRNRAACEPLPQIARGMMQHAPTSFARPAVLVILADKRCVNGSSTEKAALEAVGRDHRIDVTLQPITMVSGAPFLGVRFSYYLSWLLENSNHGHVLFLDAFDTVLVNDPFELMRRFSPSQIFVGDEWRTLGQSAYMQERIGSCLSPEERSQLPNTVPRATFTNAIKGCNLEML